MTLTSTAPYFSQWESRHLASAIIAGNHPLYDDPLWEESGAPSAEEYALWANHICGMACLKMVLAARTGIVHPTFFLLERAQKYGAYLQEEGSIRGMIYAPFNEMLKKDFSIDAEIVTNVAVENIGALLGNAQFFIASVHPFIRWPEREPPKKGGHLVLVTNVSGDYLTFHNPSGHSVESQENVTMDAQDFGRYFAGRGILI
ncbi:hypothetical protein [Pseudomonas sp. NA-150]|uniref:hypothetical protein n=1 Tax=Pseudomonas sp. NA-150 TaxID=3367525 RepID=UPI0037CBB7B5